MNRFFDKNTRNIKNITNILGVFFAITVIVPILIGPELIRILAPESYLNAKWVIQPVSCSVFFLYLYSIFSCYQFFKEKKLFIAISSVVTALLNIGLNFIFIPIFGYIAAGYTTLVCYVVYALSNYAFTAFLLKRDAIKDVYSFPVLFGTGLIVVVVSIASNLLYFHDIVRYIFLGVIVLLFLCFLPFYRRIFTHIKSQMSEHQDGDAICVNTNNSCIKNSEE